MNLLEPSLYIYASVICVWACIVFAPTDSWIDDLNTSEKFSLTFFWPIYLIIWLCISVPKHIWIFYKNQKHS